MGHAREWVEGLLAISLKNGEQRFALNKECFIIYLLTFQIFLLDVLDNMPHLRLSDDHMKSVLWMLKELNVPDTPSFYTLQKTQKRLAKDMDIQPHEHISTLGTKFHAVALEDLLALVRDAFY